MKKPSKEPINLHGIIADLQASFDDPVFGFYQGEGMERYRKENMEIWYRLVNYTADVWELSFNVDADADSPNSDDADFLFGRKESPLQDGWINNYRHVIIERLPRLTDQYFSFYLFILAILTNGRAIYSSQLFARKTTTH